MPDSTISAAQVPLPHGTEIELLAPASSERGLAPAGSLGRVVGLPTPGTLRIRVVGRGEFDVPRNAVRPRNDGQLRYAIERAERERLLGPCWVLRTVVGSRAWGLSDEASDEDTRGTFLWPFPWASARIKQADVVVSADGSHTLWEFEKTIEQALRAGPNTLKMLYVPEFEVANELGEHLRGAREAFVSREIYGSFGRYALAQSKKLAKSLWLATHREFALDELRARPELSLGQLAETFASTAAPNAEKETTTRQAKAYIKQLYRSLYDQGVIEAGSFDALREFAQGMPADLELPRELRPKNAYNLLRITSCAIQWLRTGEPLIAAEGDLRDRLLAIKRGEVPLDRSLEWTDQLAPELERAREESVLPDRPDFARADALLLEAREFAAGRWLARSDDVWGTSPLPPAGDST